MENTLCVFCILEAVFSLLQGYFSGRKNICSCFGWLVISCNSQHEHPLPALSLVLCYLRHICIVGCIALVFAESLFFDGNNFDNWPQDLKQVAFETNYTGNENDDNPSLSIIVDLLVMSWISAELQMMSTLGEQKSIRPNWNTSLSL